MLTRHDIHIPRIFTACLTLVALLAAPSPARAGAHVAVDFDLGALPSLRGQAIGDFTLNFYDDPTHLRLVTTELLAGQTRRAGLEIEATGTSRNWLFAASHLFFIFRPPSRKKFTARVHWLGWSAYLIARRPQ